MAPSKTTLLFGISFLNTISAAVSGADIKAEPLLVYNANLSKFELHTASLNLLKDLHAPIKVISAVGDARIGKSNAMSVMTSYIEADGKSSFSFKIVFWGLL